MFLAIRGPRIPVPVMTPDRLATLRNAEKLLRVGKMAAAIAEYEKVVRESPQDWDSAITLASLQARAGQVEAAVERYRGVAAAVAAKGDHARAASVHERILSLRHGDEDSLEQ